MQPLKIKKLSVQQYRIIINVICDLNCRYSNPQLSASLLSRFPNLSMHKCKNSVSDQFADVMNNTSIPHVLEHLIIDCQLNSLTANSPTIDVFGFTQWVDENRGLSKIEISFFDDLVALRSIKECIELLNKLLAPTEQVSEY